MPLTTSDLSPELLEAGLRTEFFNALQSADTPDAWQKLCLISPSTQQSETYGWLGSTIGMREFQGERLVESLKKYSFSVPNKKWEATIGITREAIEDGQYAQVQRQIEQLAMAARLHYDKLLAQSIGTGETDLCFDGTTFFADDHTYTDEFADITQSNLGTASLDDAGLQATRQAMTKYVSDKRNTLGIRPDTIIVPPELEDTAISLIKSRQLGSSNSFNVHYERYDLVVMPELSDISTTAWYMAQSNWRGLSPYVLQERTPIEFTALESTSNDGFHKDQYVYGVRARYAIAGALWFLMYKNDPS